MDKTHPVDGVACDLSSPCEIVCVFVNGAIALPNPKHRARVEEATQRLRDIISWALEQQGSPCGGMAGHRCTSFHDNSSAHIAEIVSVPMALTVGGIAVCVTAAIAEACSPVGTKQGTKLCRRGKGVSIALAVLGGGAVAAGITLNAVTNARQAEAALELYRKIAHAIRSGPNTRVLIVAHSQGCQVVHNVLAHSPEWVRSRVHVVGIGPMVTIPLEFAATCVNFYIRSDATARVGGTPFDAMQRVFDGNKARRVEVLAETPLGYEKDPHGAMAYLQHETVVHYIHSVVSGEGNP